MLLHALTRSELEETIRRKVEDSAHRRAFLQSTRTYIEKQLGAPLPPDVQVTVLEENPHLLYFVAQYEVPPGCELSDLDLEHVAGGKNDRFFSAGAGDDPDKNT